ncbi:hypothetical protein [Chryseobacterium indologenes]|uniref:hypothetical protein n=1 Tax=Chryseobacterium indologenes TaxID=253 RepID=UPI001628E47C|nr:hypothetical protein [Chryseobacterium indologenes]
MSETIISVKTPIQEKFTMSPKTSDEKKYIKSLQELLKKKRRGDWVLVSEMTGIPTESVKKAFFRVYQKNHFVVVEHLKKVIDNRNSLINIK